MTKTTKFEPGERVVLSIFSFGGADRRQLGDVACFVLNAGAEYDLILSPSEYVDEVERECLEGMLAASGLDDIEDLREGPVYVLRNMQEEDITGLEDYAG